MKGMMKKGIDRRETILQCLVIVHIALVVVLFSSSVAHGSGIHATSAMTPGAGQFIYRWKFSYLQSMSSPGLADRDLTLLRVPQIFVYGYTEDLALFGVVPLVIREGTVRPPGAFTQLDAVGIGDIRLFAKKRLWYRDKPGQTTRLGLVTGLEIPTFIEPFSSKSLDAFIGPVFSHRTLEWGVDLDLIWQFNNGKGFFRHDLLNYDAAYTKVLMTGQNLDESYWQINGVLELNGSYLTDRSHLIFASPGFQIALESLIVETSLQFPIVRNLNGRVEPDFVFMVGARLVW